MRANRQWIDNWMRNGCLTIEFEVGIDEFISFALSHPELMLEIRLGARVINVGVRIEVFKIWIL